MLLLHTYAHSASHTILKYMRTLHYTVYNVQCIVYIIQCTVYSKQCTVYSVHCTMYSVHCNNVYMVHICREYVLCTLYSIPCTYYIHTVHHIYIIHFSVWLESLRIWFIAKRHQGNGLHYICYIMNKYLRIMCWDSYR